MAAPKLLDGIEAGLTKRAANFRRPNGTHWPSKLSALLPDEERDSTYLAGTCMRQLFWLYTGRPETNPSKANGMMKMDAGSGTEGQFLDDYQKLHGFPMARQWEHWIHDPRLKWPIHGFSDGVGVDPVDVGFGIVDVKSTADYSLKIADGNGFKDYWWLQLCCYAKALREQMPHMPVLWVKVLWIARGNMNRREFTRELTDETVDAVIEAIILRLVELEQRIGLWGEDAPGYCELPEAEFANRKGYGAFPCSYCGFRKKCKQIEEGAKA